MKVGDLVKDNHPSRNCSGTEWVGMIIKNIPHNGWGGANNKMFKILWLNGTIGNNVWDYDLKIVKSA